MDLKGSVETPFGNVSKKNLLIGGGIAAILGVMWYRSYKADQAARAAATAGQSEINPVTGYPYGSAEDAAALAAQNAYQYPGGGGGGGTYTPPSTDVIVTNAQWSQEVLRIWDAQDLGDLTVMTAALGVYLAGGVPTEAQKALIQQAIALAGLPPKEGNGGYPPHINTTPPGNNPPPSGGPATSSPFQLSVTKGQKVDSFVNQIVSRIGFNFDWVALEAHNPSLAGNINWGPSGSKDTSIRFFKNAATYNIPAFTKP